MTTGIVHHDQNLEKQIEKQMGCMAGFLQLFDRHQILSGKRLYSTKRLSPSPTSDSTSPSEKSIGSPAISRELHQLPPGIRSPVPERPVSVESPARTPLPVFEFKEGLRSSWKFKEAPRLSLDSRASFDGKGSLRPKEIRKNPMISEVSVTEDNEKQRRLPSVIARLMGLEALPDSTGDSPNKSELRRSVSESRISRDLLQYRFIEGNNVQQKLNSGSNAKRDNATPVDPPKRKTEPPKPSNGGFSASPWKSQQQQQRKSFFDSQDFFPEPKQRGSIYGEIEKRLKMRGIDEPAKDLETLKQILEALQLKGLLHSKRPAEQIGNRNFVYLDRKYYGEESPIVIMKPSRSINRVGRTGIDSPPSSFRSRAGTRRNLNLTGDSSPSVTPRRETRNSRSPDRNESGTKSPSSLSRRRPLSIETQRRGNDSVEPRRSSPVHSPRMITKKVGSENAISRSPRNMKQVAEISPKAEDESSTVSECSISTSSHVDMELQRPKMEDYKEGRCLLERCDKLLHSIAEMTATELQPSPVSVLDSSFYKDESPSPIMKRCIDFKDQTVEEEDENWSPVISPVRLKTLEEEEEEERSDDSDFLYVSEILRASECLPDDSDVFLLLEKQRYNKSSNFCKESMLHRKLVFDTIREIQDRKKQLPPWKAATSEVNGVTGKTGLKQIWSEFRRVRERDTAEDLFEIICSVLRKDMAGDEINGWGDCCHVEISDEVLDIERLIFKDLVAETIRDLASFAGKNRAPVAVAVAVAPRRKLVF